MKTQSTRSFIISWIIVIVLCTVGWIYATLDYIKTTKLGNDSKNWPTTEGVVLDHEIDRNTVPNSASYIYIPKVKFRYTVNDQSFISKEITFFPEDYFGEDDAKEFLAHSEYTIGSKVEISYNPDSPEMSVLEPGAPHNTAVVIGFLVTIWSAFVYITFRFVRGFARDLK